jgi:hypothetical protein
LLYGCQVTLQPGDKLPGCPWGEAIVFVTALSVRLILEQVGCQAFIKCYLSGGLLSCFLPARC